MANDASWLKRLRRMANSHVSAGGFGLSGPRKAQAFVKNSFRW
jgi:hypothetical protein